MAQPSEELATTPLFPQHKSLGARMMAFGGFEMPVQYSSITEEHMAVRNDAGLFDVSHMGEVIARGSNATNFVQHLITNDASRLSDGQAQYTVMCTEDGGTVDDLLVYRISEEEWMLVINAANRDSDYEWMQNHNPMDAHLINRSEDIAQLALQGPKSFEIAATLGNYELDELKPFHFHQLKPGTFFNCDLALISATGYTGEKGLEIYCDADKADNVWNTLLEKGESMGLKPAGLGARDTLRLEAGYMLYGNDLSREINPLEAGLSWLVKLDKGDFVGRDALKQIKQNGLKRKLVAFVMQDRGIPRHDYPILNADEEEIGVVTSGSQSPVLETGIGMGFVPNEPPYTEPEQSIYIEVRGRSLEAIVKKPPLHKNS